jgi:hypothetical protein
MAAVSGLSGAELDATFKHLRDTVLSEPSMVDTSKTPTASNDDSTAGTYEIFSMSLVYGELLPSSVEMVIRSAIPCVNTGAVREGLHVPVSMLRPHRCTIILIKVNFNRRTNLYLQIWAAARAFHLS